MEKFKYKNLLQYFLQGVLIIAPLVITCYFIFAVISTIDGWLPIFSYTDIHGQVHVQNYGIGFLLILSVIVIIGYFSSFMLPGRIMNFMDKGLQKTPGIKHIYSTTREFVEAFAGNKKKFTQNVLVNIDGNDIWRIAFITNEDMKEFGLKDYASVYVPTSYSLSGSVYIIPKDRIKIIDKISSAQTMKFVVSGGVTQLLEEPMEIKQL